MPLIPPECCVALRHPKIKLSGPRTTTLYLLNPERREVERITVDGCAITDGLRCDWLVRTDDNLGREEIFVELKGADIKHAIDQIKATITRLSVDAARGKKRCFVVLTRNPMTGTDVQRTMRTFRDKYKARFLAVRDHSEHSL